MNGIHDMGGMHGMGPIQVEQNEPVFHAPWEGRFYALMAAMGAWRKWNLDASRFQRELMPPADYLRLSYYERRIVPLSELMLKSGLVTRAELRAESPIRDQRNRARRSRLKKCPFWFPRGDRRGGMFRWGHAFRRVSTSELATCIPWGIPACRAMREERLGRSVGITECFFFRTLTLCSSARSRSMYIRCVLRHVSCGETKPHRRTLCTLICGMTILNQPDSIPQPENLAALPRLPRDEGGPVFAEPWQAQAFALAVRLSAQGHFTWKEWAAALADELKAAADRGEPDDGSRYYHHWLAALERLVTAKRLSDPTAMLQRKAAWAEAYRRTPHGKPVELANSSS
jgi:nitrile hydratase accessory protein